MTRTVPPESSCVFVGWRRVFEAHQAIEKSWPSWPSSVFRSLLRRFEVGQLGHLRRFLPFSSGGRGSTRAVLCICRVASSLRGPPKRLKKVGQVGQVPIFVGFCCRFEFGQLHSFSPYVRQGEVPSESLYATFLHFVSFVSFCSKIFSFVLFC